MALGQLRLLRARVPITRVLADPATSDEERERLSLVLEVRDYARDLGLDVGEQYTSFAPWPGDRLVTAVVAARPGSLEPEGFWFPLVGRVPYKSYFQTSLASREAEALRARGLDVCLSAVPAYSTLGWLGDPLTGPLLRAPRTDLVATVIHELVHATVYVRDQPDFNEGLASFVGEEGALAFFAERDGPDAASVREARQRIGDERAVSDVTLWLRARVGELYEAEPSGPAREARRQELEREARARLAALPLVTIDAAALAENLRTNDACLALAGAYEGDRKRYEAMLARFGGDLPAFVSAARAAAETQDPRATLFGP